MNLLCWCGLLVHSPISRSVLTTLDQRPYLHEEVNGQGHIILSSETAAPRLPVNLCNDIVRKYLLIFFFGVMVPNNSSLEKARFILRSSFGFNVAQELQYEILSGRYVIGKGKLNETEETAIAALASAVAAVPRIGAYVCRGIEPASETRLMICSEAAVRPSPDSGGSFLTSHSDRFILCRNAL